MLFHCGALLRLNELRLLGKLDWVSSVSGGSITAGVLGRAWPSLAWTDDGHAENLSALVVEPLREIARHRIDVLAFLIGFVLPGRTPATRFASVLDDHLFHGATLQDLPNKPRFVFNATNLASRVLWRFEKRYMRDYLVGEILNPTVPLATAVAASSGFPPAFAPLWLELEPRQITPGSSILDPREFGRRIPLADGGVYDNLGLESAWKRWRTLLVSDGGGETPVAARPALDPIRQTLRVMKIIDRQVRSLRKRELIESYGAAHDGTYWGIRTDIADYQLSDALPAPLAATCALAQEPTRLTRMPDTRQEQLINWGYAVSDAALRKHYLTGRDPGTYPYPRSGVGA
jgi:NTE family protein